MNGTEWREGSRERKERLTSAVEGHARGAGELVLLDALLLDGLLGDDVARGEEDGGGDALGEQGPGGQAGLVPLMSGVSDLAPSAV